MATVKIDEFDLEQAPAAEDLSTWQNRLVRLNENGELVKAGAGEVAFVLQNKPKQGQTGTYAVFGRVKCLAGATIKPNQLLSSDASGRIVPATATVLEAEKVKTQGTRVIGYAVAKGAAGEIVSFRATPTAGRA
jgi:hypothetical protein